MEENTKTNWEKEILEQIGFTIKLYRLKSKLRCNVLAKCVNISRNTLWNIEQGKRFSLPTIINICETLKIRPTTLFIEAILNIESNQTKDSDR